MPQPSTLALFLLAGVVLVIVPGPNILYIVARGVHQGRTAGLISALGVETGTLLHVAAAALGLSAVLASSATAFAAVKYVGAAYLLWLGVRALLAKESAREEIAPPAGIAARRLLAGSRRQSAQPEDGALFPRLFAAVRRSGPGAGRRPDPGIGQPVDGAWVGQRLRLRGPGRWRRRLAERERAVPRG
jgi:hypothetical protein